MQVKVKSRFVIAFTRKELELLKIILSNFPDYATGKVWEGEKKFCDKLYDKLTEIY